MSRKENIRKKLNLTQEDMAMILKINRSQWALYELGLRGLSTTATLRLSQIERSFLSDEVSMSKQSEKIEVHELKKKKFLADALKENELRQIACKRKIDRLEKGFEAAMNLHQLIDFIADTKDEKYILHPGALQKLNEKAEKAFGKNGPLQLLKLELQQELLKHETVLLNKLLKGSREA